MSKYSEFLKKRAESDRNWYFGENNYKAVSNKFFTYKAVLNDDEIIIRTNDVKIFKNNYVLIVGSNDVVYLKDFQVREVHTWCKVSKDNFYLVKLNRKYFKPYHFTNAICNYEGKENVDTFDDLLQVAKEQDDYPLQVGKGWMQI
jgi:hypothetical protein